MSRGILNNIINDFQVEKPVPEIFNRGFIRFFREKNRSFAPRKAELAHYDDENFKDGLKLGEIKFSAGEQLIICIFQANQPLSERSGKKAQYEKGKKILKDSQSDAGIFIFYDEKACFRFSLIYPEYTGTKRQWSYFKRFTYFVSPELTNKTFLQQIGEGDFSSLQKIKEAFSVEPVTKQFYGELQYWYFWAMDKIKFPDDYKYSSDPAKDKEIRNATNLIRLITRIIFIRFLSEKGLIPPELFSREKLGSIIKDFMNGKKASNFYNAILQNLFFGTLNQKMDERRFADERGYPANIKEYGVKNLYRYGDKFLINKDKALALFKDIPFLNGGLFDCLDKDDESSKVIYVDGFSRNSAKQSIIPDYLFFQHEEERVDLSNYGLGSNRTVRGLIEILHSYNFTIDENTPVDQEIALDPELLGKVFENLLASYNPETATTARKATGSYYTPREIVDYMVQESLIAYLMTKLTPSPQSPPIKGGDVFRTSSPLVGEGKGEGDNESRLRQLLSYTDEPHQFSPSEGETIISAIDNIKILDPACGSGAFPMGILHKLVYALQKLDPENRYWHELQYKKALKESEDVFKQGDKNEREERLKEINETFDEGINYPDYARKLYLIENCIYGVDIQPIAIQISKLRFFISLVLDQKVDRGKENLGIRALPNLETKFVAANTLIGLEMPQSIFYTDKIRKLEDEIKSLRHKYFQAKTRREKLDYQKKDRELRGLLAEELKGIGFSSDSSKKIATFDLYDQNASADFFDPEWMFGIKNPSPLAGESNPITPSPLTGEGKGEGGFDIVIANPPYVRQEDIKHLKPVLQKQNFEVYNSTSDLYTYFYEKAYQILGKNGVFCFISSNKFMKAKYGEKLRRLLQGNTALKQIIDFGGHKVFESATVDTCIVVFVKEKKDNNTVCLLNIADDFTPQTDIQFYFAQKGFCIPQSKLSHQHWTIAEDRILRLKEKIEKTGTILKDWDVRIYRGIITGFNEAFIVDNETKERLCKEDPKCAEVLKPILRGRDIERYSYKWAGLWLIKIESGWTNKNKGKKDPEAFFEDTYPAIYNHLKTMGERQGKGKGLYQRDDQGDYWWELRDCAYYGEFEKEKIVYPDIADRLSFVFENGVNFVNNTTYFLNAGNKYLLAVLNSLLANFYYKQISSQLGNDAARAFTVFIEQLPIPKIPDKAQQPFITLVDQILAAKKKDPNADTSALERQIDEMVYELYNLTPDEIAIIERGKK